MTKPQLVLDCPLSVDSFCSVPSELPALQEFQTIYDLFCCSQRILFDRVHLSSGIDQTLSLGKKAVW